MLNFKPIAVRDISHWLLYEGKGKKVYSVGSISRDRYLKVEESLLKPFMKVIEFFDGERTVEEIKIAMLTKHNLDIDVELVCEKLAKADLIENNPNPEKVEKQEFEKFFLTLLKVPIGKWSKGLAKLSKKIFGLIFLFSFCIILIGSIFLIINIETLLSFRSYTIANSVGTSLLISLPLFLITFILHELAHAIIATQKGLEPSDLVVGFYASFSAMIYLKIPGIYTLKKKDKIILWSAGVYANLFLATVIAIVANFVVVDNIHSILNIMILINIGFFISNLSPFLPLDGYYLLSTIFNLPNLRKNSFTGVFKVIFKKEIGFKYKVVYVIYFLLSFLIMSSIVVYQIILAFSWFYSQLKKYGSVYEVIINSNVIIGIIVLIIARSAAFFIKKIYKLYKKRGRYQHER